jgi:amidase
VKRYPIDPFTPAVELAAAIRRKEVSPVEVADCYLERMDEFDPRLNAFCHRADDDVRNAASAAAGAMVRAASAGDLPPFHGVPLPIKDLLDVAGWPTTHGSAGASKAPADASHPVVQRFADAGFVLLGKTTTSEFGAVPFTESGAPGISRNPWDPGRTPGGSSSGAGVAVAAGLAPIAHAADGGASIRVPASCTGLVGLKPTRAWSPTWPSTWKALPPAACSPAAWQTPRPPWTCSPAMIRRPGGHPRPRRGPSPAL